jgi:uncharacterized OB-fold protein
VAYTFYEHRLEPFIECGDAFWEGLEDGHFRLCRCASCQRWLWHTQYGGLDIRCGVCGSWDVEWVDVEPEGKVYAWLRTNQPFEGAEEFWDLIPYVTIEAELFGPGGPRVIGLLRGPEDGLRVGATVRGEIEPPSEKTKWYAALRWRLAKEGNRQ